MVVVGLLSVIILGLVAMFTQTQRAFRLGMSQTDVLETGRIATDLISRELQEAAPSPLPATNLFTSSFYTGPVPYQSYRPLYLPLPGPGNNQQRLNPLQDLFFLQHENQNWKGIGYCVRTGPGFKADWGPVGTLYRFETNMTNAQLESGLPQFRPDSAFFQSRNDTPGVSRILDGVVQFRVNTYDINGRLIQPGWTNNPAGFESISSRNGTNYYFFGKTIPAYVEVELGILEPEIYERYRAIPVATARSNYLQNQVGRVHIFRQRIALRNVDPAAYP